MSFSWAFLLKEAFDGFAKELDHTGDHKQTWKEDLMSLYIWDWSAIASAEVKPKVEQYSWRILSKNVFVFVCVCVCVFVCVCVCGEG